MLRYRGYSSTPKKLRHNIKTIQIIGQTNIRLIGVNNQRNIIQFISLAGRLNDSQTVKNEKIISHHMVE